MLNISFSEILLILIISLLIFGPEQLPIIAHKLGKMFAFIRNFSLNLREQFYQQTGLDQFETFRDEVKQSIHELKHQLNINDLADNDYFQDENQTLYQDYQFMYQPELDFERQPELFDE